MNCVGGCVHCVTQSPAVHLSFSAQCGHPLFFSTSAWGRVPDHMHGAFCLTPCYCELHQFLWILGSASPPAREAHAGSTCSRSAACLWSSASLTRIGLSGLLLSTIWNREVILTQTELCRGQVVESALQIRGMLPGAALDHHAEAHKRGAWQEILPFVAPETAKPDKSISGYCEIPIFSISFWANLRVMIWQR